MCAALDVLEIRRSGIAVGFDWRYIHFRPGLFKRLKGAVTLFKNVGGAAPVRQIKMWLVYDATPVSAPGKS